MFRRTAMHAALAASIMILTVVPAAGDDAPARIFASAERLAKVRKAVKESGSHHARAFAALKTRVDKGDLSAYTSTNKYDKSYGAREAAFAYLVTQDKKYAQRAYDIVEAIYKDPKQSVNPLRKSGLNRAMMSIGVAIPYNWCFDAWTADQRKFVKGKIDEALNAWPRFGHANVRHPYVSNWAAVTRGGELIMMACAGEVENRKKRYDQIKSHLERHMKFGFGDLGVSQEGAGYTEYPGGFLLTAVYAAKDLGDDELWKVAQTRPWWKMAMYSHNFQPHERKFVMTGVSHTSNFDEGWSSLLLHHCPDEQLPYFLWWYDRHMGVKAPGGPQDRFDSQRAGTVWSVLYYPVDVKPKDPTGVWPVGVADSRGYYFFRNRWKDADDILTSIMADTVHHGHAWDQPEQLAIDLMGWNTRFIGGPGKSRDDKLYSALLVDGKYNIRHSVRYTGKKVHFEADKTGGYAIVGGGELYKKLGVDEARRHLCVKFAEKPDGVRESGVISTLDRVKSDKEHTYTWQANLGNEKGDDDVKAVAGTDAGRPSLTLTGRNGWVKAWVMHPADAKVKAGDPTRIEAKGANADIWVVMVTGNGTAPKATVTGTGLDSMLKIGGVTVKFDAKADRIKIE